MGRLGDVDWNLVLLILVLVGDLAVLRGLVELRSAVVIGIEELDGRLAATIAKLVEEFGGGFEPPNPIQQAIATMLANRVQELPRSEGGQFIEEKVKLD